MVAWLFRLIFVITLPGLLSGSEANQIRLARIRSHMSDNLNSLPNYTCTQTIERSQRPARGRRFQLLDTIRLEVAMVEGRELFAWPGSGKFEDRELRELVGNGTSGNGNFGLHARAVFLGNGVTFEYMGEVEKEDGRVYQYAFHVPTVFSGYMIRMGNVGGVAGYHGYFEADTTTLDVLSFDVIADDEIPPRLQLLEGATRMRYHRMKIGEGDFLLPTSSEIAMTDYAGNISRNAVTLSGCKQYATESTISFGDPPPVSEAPALPASAGKQMVGELPAGLTFDATLQTPLPFPGAAVGDLVELAVSSDAKRKGAIMIPKGTLARGRIIRFGPFPLARVPTMIVLIELHELELPGGLAQIHGVAEGIQIIGAAGARFSVDNGLIYIVSGNRRELSRGMRIRWRLEPKIETR